MIFHQTPLAGVFLVDLEPIGDERGFFARAFDSEEFARYGIDSNIDQCSLAFNRHRYTLRGVHFQRDPHGETKMVRCVRGVVHDVAVDLRPTSPSFGEHVAVELSAENRRALVLPPQVGHGYLTLAPATELFYLMSHRHVAEAFGGIRYDDPDLGIAWPVVDGMVISERDRHLPTLNELSSAFG